MQVIILNEGHAIVGPTHHVQRAARPSGLGLTSNREKKRRKRKGHGLHRYPVDSVCLHPSYPLEVD